MLALCLWHALCAHLSGQRTLIQTYTNMRSSRNYSLEAFIAKMSLDEAKANRELGNAHVPKGAHNSQGGYSHGKSGTGREPSAPR